MDRTLKLIGLYFVLILVTNVLKAFHPEWARILFATEFVAIGILFFLRLCEVISYQRRFRYTATATEVNALNPEAIRDRLERVSRRIQADDEAEQRREERNARQRERRRAAREAAREEERRAAAAREQQRQNRLERRTRPQPVEEPKNERAPGEPTRLERLISDDED